MWAQIIHELPRLATDACIKNTDSFKDNHLQYIMHTKQSLLMSNTPLYVNAQT
jgi:hypothetical protein